MDRRIAIALVALVAVGALFFALRPDDGDEGQATTTTTETQPTFEPAPTLVPPEETWRIDAVDDALDRRTVAKDARLTIIVTADTSDEVHIHGYDLTAPVSAGKPAAIFVRTTMTGRFEIELEDAHEQIAQLTVTP